MALGSEPAWAVKVPLLTVAETNAASSDWNADFA